MEDQEVVEEQSAEEETVDDSGSDEVAAQAKPPELTAEEKKAATVAARLEVLTKKDLALQKRAQEQKSLLPKIAEAERILETFKDPNKAIEYLEKNNPDLFKVWANKILGQKEAEPDDNQKALSRVEKLEAKLAEAERSKKEMEESQLWTKYIGDTTEKVRGNPEYALVVALGSEAEVAELIKLHYNESGEVMEFDEAAKMVNKHLTDKYSELAKNPVIQKLVDSARASASKEPPKKEAAKDISGKPKTITNRASSAAPARPVKKKLTADAAWAAIMAQAE